MTVRGRRIFNRRPVCFFALFLAAGILAAEAFYPIPHIYRLIPLLLTAAVCVFFACCGKCRRYIYIAAAFFIGFISCSGAADVYDSRLTDDVTGTFTAKVSSEIIVEDGMAEFYVEDLAADGKVLKGECRVYADITAPDFGAGDVIALTGRLTAERHEAFDSYFASNALNGTYFTLRADGAELLADGEPDFVLSVQLAVSRLFYEHMDKDASVIARALVIGDQRGIDDLLYGDIQASGLAHVLSVSGLHITALASAVYWLFRKLGVNPKIALVVVLGLGLFYVALCGFVPPAVRALVMTGVFNFGSAFGLKRDGLSALAFAAAAIMTFSPFSLMHVGFLLSVFSLFGIMAFADPIKKFLMKGVDKVAPPRLAAVSVNALHGTAAIQSGEIPGEEALAALAAAADEGDGSDGARRGAAPRKKKLRKARESVLRRALGYAAESSAVAVAANLTSMPVAAYFFGRIQTLFVISNIVILPYAVFIYLFLIVITPFALITGLHGLVGAADWLIMPFTAFVRAIGGISFASVPVSVSVTGVVCVLFAEILLSRFLFLRRMERAVGVMTSAAVFLAVASAALLA